MLADLFVLFLLSAASLPDAPGEMSDLRVHYARGRRYFWTLVVIFQASYLLNGLYFLGADLWGPHSYRAASVLVVNMVLPCVVALALLLSRSGRLHYLGIAAPYQIN